MATGDVVQSGGVTIPSKWLLPYIYKSYGIVFVYLYKNLN